MSLQCPAGARLTRSIICGIITMPCGFLVLAVLPNYPNKGKRWWLTDAEFELAQARMQRVNRVQSDGLVNLTVLKRIFSNWRKSTIDGLSPS